MSKTLRALSIFVGILSLVSFIEHLFSVGLHTVFSDLIIYYRNVTYTFYGFFEALLSIKLPPKLLDLWNVSFLGAAAYIKTSNIEGSRLLRNFDLTKHHPYWKIIYFFFIGFSLSGIGILLAAYVPQTYLQDFDEEEPNLMKGTLVNSAYVFMGIIIFFVFNAFAPSL